MIERFFLDDSKSLDNMISWLKKAREWTSDDIGNTLLFCTLTGLRSSESIEAIKLIKNPKTFKIYYNEDKQLLEHFRFAKTFIRRTKAAFATIADGQIIGIAKKIEKVPHRVGAISMSLNRRSLSMNMAYCRKIYASWLRQAGVGVEIIDLLQGRIGKNIFMRHYYRPNHDYKERVLLAVSELQKRLD